jgi:hypothetical protein
MQSSRMLWILPSQRNGRGQLTGEEGQTLVEFALILPLLLIVVLGIIDLGKAFGYKNDETNLANQAARLAAVNQCPGGCTSIEAWIRNQAPNELRLGTGSIAPPGLQAISAIKFEFTDPGPLNHCVGDSVKATIKAHYNWLNFLKGVLPSLGTDITASATMRLEKDYSRTNPALNKYAPLNPTEDICPP